MAEPSWETWRLLRPSRYFSFAQEINAAVVGDLEQPWLERTAIVKFIEVSIRGLPANICTDANTLAAFVPIQQRNMRRARLAGTFLDNRGPRGEAARFSGIF